MKKLTIYISAFLLLSCSCENREVNPETGPDFSEIHDNLEYHFDRVKIDGYEYLILERDRNNPHEGFGFMALNGTRIGGNQDTLRAYLKTVLEVQSEILGLLNEEPKEDAAFRIDEILKNNLSQIKPYQRKTDAVSKKAKD
ncbi:MAG: hypothetical protein RIG77_20190 [Cyclobacteriaceae bacterium]